MSDLQFMLGHVFHSRSETAKNSFRYPILNIFSDVSDLPQLNEIFKSKFFNFLGLKPQNYLSQKQKNLHTEITDFVQNRFNYTVDKVRLQTMPKMFGYVFNPVSFWYFYQSQKLDAVLCEVNNTFGEKHYYWLHQEGRDLNGEWLETKKEFHVSPFFKVDGKYKFKFVLTAKTIEANIQFFNSDESLRLITWVRGELKNVDEVSIFKIILKYGWMTPLVVLRIHYQAAKLFFKKVQFYTKPNPPQKEITDESSLTGR